MQSFLVMCSRKKRWKMQILAGKKVNEIAMASDEAFILLVLESYGVTWKR